MPTHKRAIHSTDARLRSSFEGFRVEINAAAEHRVCFLPYQRRWIDDTSVIKLGDKSRRTGWTWCEAFDAVSRRFRGTHLSKSDYWFSSADDSAAAEFIEYCRFFAQAIYQQGASHVLGRNLEILTDPSYTSYRIKCPNGTKITAMSSNPRRFRSKGGDVCLDEFDFHGDPEAMWDAASPVTQWGGSLRVFSTPNGEGTFFGQLIKSTKQLLACFGITSYRKRDRFPSYEELCAKASESGISPVVSYHRVTIEDAIEEGIVERINEASNTCQTRGQFLAACRARSRSEDAFRQEYMCEPSTEWSAWLTCKLISACEDETCPAANEPLTGYASGPCDVGVDVGRKRDLTVITVLENVGDVLWQRQRLEISGVSLPEQEQILAGVLRSVRLRRCCIDMSGIGLGLFEYTQRQFGRRRIEGIQFTNPAKEVLAVDILKAFEDRAIRINVNDQTMRDDLGSVHKGVTATNLVRFDGERGPQGHADRFWSLALAIHAGRGKVVRLPEFTGAGRAIFAREGAW